MSERCERMSFTLPAPLARSIRAAAAERSETISGWLVGAAERRLRLEGGRTVLAEWAVERGLVIDEERAAIEMEITAGQA
ncbi:MAG: hypothetical protein ACRD0K_01395 [Egibacteraceae bacterium]